MIKSYLVTLPNRTHEVVFDIPEDAKNVGVMLSGGVDSTLVLCMLVALQKELKFTITAFTVENRNNAQKYVTALLKFPEFQNIKHIDNISNNSDFTGIIDQGILNVLQRTDVDLLFTGVTANPPHLDAIGPVRHGAEVLQAYPKLRCPFMFLTKDVLLKMYAEHCPFDWKAIYKSTHSCTEMTVGECRVCFQCIEKAWAEAEAGFKTLAETK